MHAEGVFLQVLAYLAAAVVAVPIAKRLGLGSVLGYLAAGVVIGPRVLGIVGQEGQDVMHFAEFGVVLMLFLIGLELEPALLWRLRAPILGLGGMQVGITTVALTAVAMLLGVDWRPALAIGLILGLSSTAMVLQTLEEKGLSHTRAGRSAFAVLLFQDIAVIPILALLPFLATASSHGADAAGHGESTTWLSGQPPWMAALIVLGAVAGVVAGGRFLVVPALRAIARARLREIFTAAALLLVIGVALLMTRVGLSPALGTFLAGVVLAGSEYRHELEADIEPFKGLLLGLFFIAVGASIDFGTVAEQPLTIAALVAGLFVVKLVVLALIARPFGLTGDQGRLFSLSLAQGGEFAFVLFSFATGKHVLDPELAGLLVVVVALSMALTPLVLLLNEKLIQPRFGTTERPEREEDAMDERNPVVVAGFGRFGLIVGRLLRAKGVSCTFLDLDSDHVDLLRRLDLDVYYGDASREDLLRAAGAAEAQLLVVATDEPAKTLEIVQVAQKHFPDLTILARARGRAHAYQLHCAGVEHVYRETLDTSLRAGVDALRMLGFRGVEAWRAARSLRRHDVASIGEMARVAHDRDRYLLRARETIREAEELLREDDERRQGTPDTAWDDTTIRKDFGAPES